MLSLLSRLWFSPGFGMAKSVFTQTPRPSPHSATAALGVLVTSFSPCSRNDGASQPRQSGSAASPCCLHLFRGKGKQDPPKREPAFFHWFPPRLVFFISLVQLKGYRKIVQHHLSLTLEKRKWGRRLQWWHICPQMFPFRCPCRR